MPDSTPPPAPSRTEVLPYYLQDFRRVYRTVIELDRALLSPKEREDLARLLALGLPAQALLLRFHGRRPEWLAASGLCYKEIPDTAAALRELEEAAFLHRWNPQDGLPEGLLACLKRRDCLALLGRGRDTGRLPELRTALLERGPREADASVLRDWWRFEARLLLDTVLLLFFANRRQGLESFVIEALGHLRHPPVRVSRVRLFRSLDERVHFQALASLRDELEQDLADDGLRETKLETAVERARSRPPRDGNWSPGDRLLDAAAEGIQVLRCAWLEQQEDPAAAGREWITLLEQSPRRRTREHALRRALILGVRAGEAKDLRQCLALCDTGLGADEGQSPAFRQELERRRSRLQKKLGHAVIPASRWRSAEVLELEAPRNREQAGRACWGWKGQQTVEDWVLEQVLQAEGGLGGHLENALPRALLALLAWPILHAPLPGAFLHPFQAAPLDWGSEGFADRRRSLIERTLRAVGEGRAPEIARDTLRRRDGYHSAFIQWETLDRELLMQLIGGWPPRSLAGILRLLLEQPAYWRRGFPDLSLVDRGGHPCFIEVKGPGDSLRPEQEQWIDRLLGEGLKVRLCRVREQREPSPEAV